MTQETRSEREQAFSRLDALRGVGRTCHEWIMVNCGLSGLSERTIIDNVARRFREVFSDEDIILEYALSLEHQGKGAEASAFIDECLAL